MKKKKRLLKGQNREDYPTCIKAVSPLGRLPRSGDVEAVFGEKGKANWGVLLKKPEH